MTEQEEVGVPPVEELLTDPVEDVESTEEELEETEAWEWPDPADDPDEEPAETLEDDGTPGTGTPPEEE